MYQKPEGSALVMRACLPGGESYGGFVWPLTPGAAVEAPDWAPTEECGAGLHGWLEAENDLACSAHWTQQGAVWLALEVEQDLVLHLGGKVKFPRAKVVFSGSLEDTAAFVHKHGGWEAPVIGLVGAPHVGPLGTATAGYEGTATAGYKGTATAGLYGTAMAGYKGTATAGYKGTAMAGLYGTATAGDRGTTTAGHCGTATAGRYGTAMAGNYGAATAGNYGAATAGYGGTATAGDGGTATAGDGGTATAGYEGTATAGYEGTATAGDGGTITLAYYDGRKRLKVGYIGEDGLKPNVAYKLDATHNFVEA